MATIDRRGLLAGGVAALGMSGLIGGRAAAAEPEIVPVAIDTRERTGALPHIWSESAGSDRAAITLRESWRRDLARWQREAGLKRVRCHGILNDELGVDAPSILNGNKPVANYRNVDAVYDGLLANGVDPLVELSFMPKALASGDATFGFYHGNITPPASLDAWGGFVRDFVRHLGDRYGAPTLRRWPFEVWNEPNLAFFWTGDQQRYFDLYRTTALAIKSVDPAIMVGGPATSGGAWVTDMARFCATTNTPIDFVSTHAYAGDKQRQTPPLPIADIIPDRMRRCRADIDASPLAGKPLWLTEWASDSPAMIAHVIRECLATCQVMSHWVLSGTYEELGVAPYILKEGDSGYGTIVDGIAKPSFNTYKLLHALGGERLRADGPALASRTAGGGVAALVWNLAQVVQPSGIPGVVNTRSVSGTAKRMAVTLAGLRPGQPVRVTIVDQERGSPMPAWRAMGSPALPTPTQMTQLRAASAIPPARTLRLDAQRGLVLDLPPEGVALIEAVHA